MADIDFAELAKDPIYVGLVLGLLGILIYFALGRKSFGPVPSAPFRALAYLYNVLLSSIIVMHVMTPAACAVRSLCVSSAAIAELSSPCI